MKRPTPGHYVDGSTGPARYQAFVPDPLPPNPPIEWSPDLRRRFDDALVALGALDAAAALLPNTSVVLYSFIRKEAVLTSQIEGTQSSLSDLLLFEIDEEPGVPVDDTHEVSRYIAAMDTALAGLHDGLPVCMRLLRNAHAALLDHPRGRTKAPGKIRRTQVWLGGTNPGNAAFVPPPADRVAACLADFERFLNDHPEPTPPLLKAALAHVQFETIHPFLDGNGRIGRLLIVLQLVADGILRTPLLYPSLFFKKHRALYYQLLDGIRQNGDWESWLDFFAEGIAVSARQAVSTAQALLKVSTDDKARLDTLGRATPSAAAVHTALQKQPIATAGTLVTATGLTPATVNKSLQHLTDLGIVTELTNRRRGRVFSYRQYVDLLNAEL